MKPPIPPHILEQLEIRRRNEAEAARLGIPKPDRKAVREAMREGYHRIREAKGEEPPF